MGLIPRVLLSWRAPGRAVQGLVGMSEPAVLVLLIATMAVYFIAQWPVHARAAALDPSVPLQARLGGALMATLFLMPLVVMAAAGIVHLVGRALGLRLNGRSSRLALVWALTAAAPAMLLAGLVRGLVGTGPGPVVAQLLAGAAFVIFWAAGVRALSREGLPS